jgi:predicted homoserine dehydrogenase-like protein
MVLAGKRLGRPLEGSDHIQRSGERSSIPRFKANFPKPRGMGSHVQHHQRNLIFWEEIMSITQSLLARAEASNPVRVGVIGAGEMGTDIVTQLSLMPGMQLAVLAEVRESAAIHAIDIAHRPRESAQVCSKLGDVEDTIRAGKTAIVTDSSFACTAEQVDVIIDATGNPGVGAELAILAMEHRKHVVMMNVEADITIGAYLVEQARRAGVVYTLGAGDEPSSTMEIVNFARSLGYPIIAAGKGKNNPMKFDAVPADYEEEAARRNMNARMLVEFIDGSKTMIEMVALANATGLVPDVPGMHGPDAGVSDLAQVLCPKEDGGILSKSGVVDYTVGKGVAPGVFVVVKAPHERIHERLRDLKMGPGPYFTFYRPYHLTSLEVPLTAAEAVINKAPLMQSLPQPVAEVATLAKRDLKPGESLGKIGEDEYRGWTLTVEDARTQNALPLGLAERAVVTQPIKAGELLTYANCRPDEKMKIVQLRQLQDQMLASTESTKTGS